MQKTCKRKREKAITRMTDPRLLQRRYIGSGSKADSVSRSMISFPRWFSTKQPRPAVYKASQNVALCLYLQ